MMWHSIVGAGVLMSYLGGSISAQSREVAQLTPAVLGELASVQNTLKPDGKISVQLQDVLLETAIKTIVQRAGLKVAYANDVLPKKLVSVDAVEVPVEILLRQVLRGTELVVRPVDAGVVRIVRSSDLKGDARRSGVVTGRVINANTRQPIEGAIVTLEGSTVSVRTGSDGRFRMQIPAGEQTVRVRAVGFGRAAHTVTVQDGQVSEIAVTLEPGASVLDQVIVTGTVVATERKAISTPITVFTAEDIERRGITRIEQLFRGEVPGVFAIEQGTQTYTNQDYWNRNDTLGKMAIAKVYARGSASLSGAPNPLKTYIDGVELLDASYLGTIDPMTIERVEIVTGPQAATIYGSGALGGVMQIFTKKGMGANGPDVTFNLRYGMLESNLSNGRTPQHTHNVSVAGGALGEFSYAGNLSYEYTGQWQPGLFNRRYSGTVGATHTRGGVTANGSLSMTSGTNGTTGFISGRSRQMLASGEWDRMTADFYFIGNQHLLSKTSSMTLSLALDYRPFTFWSHQVTAGRNQVDMALVPQAPMRASPGDSVIRFRSSSGKRTTASYNTTLMSPRMGVFSRTLTMGVNGSEGQQAGISGAKVTKSASVYTNPTVTEWRNDRSGGGFGSAQIGVFDQVFLTLGVRGERNPSYGEEVKIDWTPTAGITYVLTWRDMTLKLLGSYGRATRPPTPSLRNEQFYADGNLQPSVYLRQFANPELRPEYSRGPQGGIEFYYGNIASFTVNRYVQRVTDLIQSVTMDSILVLFTDWGYYYYDFQQQYQNTAAMRQHGWEVTSSATARFLTFKGAYSWADSRILSVHPQYIAIYTGADTDLYPGKSPSRAPSHTGSTTLSYALGATSISLVSNYIGAGKKMWYGTAQETNSRFSRIRFYIDRTTAVRTEFYQAGYVKSDLRISRRLTPHVTALANATNLGNSYGGEELTWLHPTLGRQTLLGISYRFSQR